MKRTDQRGFTIVELITIIVVIGILMGIGIFSYSGITRDARDTQRRTDAETIALALGSWSRDNDKTPIQTGGGQAGNGEGWVRSSSYGTNIEQVLIDREYLERPVEASNAPEGTNGYALFACDRNNTAENRYGIFMQLEAVRDEDQAAVDEWQSAGCNMAPFSSPYNANAVEIFTFRQ